MSSYINSHVSSEKKKKKKKEMRHTVPYMSYILFRLWLFQREGTFLVSARGRHFRSRAGKISTACKLISSSAERNKACILHQARDHDDYTVVHKSYYEICCNFLPHLRKAGSDFNTGVCHIENKFELPNIEEQI